MTQCGHQPGFVSAPKLTIPRAISDAITAYLHTVRRFSLFIFIVSLAPSQVTRERDFARAGNKLMRLFFIWALCAILIGCSRAVPPRGMVQTCTLQGCVTRTAATTPIEPKRAPFRPGAKIRTVKSKKVAMAAKPAAAKPRNQIKPVKEKANSRTVTEPEVPPSAQPSATPDPVPKNETTTIGGETEGPATGQPSETSDPVLKKAKITVAAKMENSASAEFVDMKRVMRENIFGQPFEVICGHVKGKKKSGEATGERSFLYLVKEDEAFIVGSNPDSMAAIAYRAHCTSPNSQR
jgi:hypothetical protein